MITTLSFRPDTAIHAIMDELWKYLYGKLLEITTHYPKRYFKKVNHDKDHTHLLVSIPPQMTVGSVVRLIKINTARNIKQTFPILKKYYWGIDSLWSEGYFVSTVGITTEVIERYIAKQGEHDIGQTATRKNESKHCAAVLSTEFKKEPNHM